MPTKYLAITIAGAVSLGSYEAGAMYEILDAIRQHNEDQRTRDAGDFIKVDVVTGASAGGMTAAILAQKLLFAGNAFVDQDGKSSPHENPLYDTWVERIDLSGLIGTKQQPLNDTADPARLSILSSSLIETISVETLEQSGPDGLIPSAGPHAAIDPARGIKLGLALTNITGIDFGQPMSDGSVFQYTDFSDQMLRDLTPAPNPANHSAWRDARALATWTELAGAAVACGAFPVAFRTKSLLRRFADFAADEPLDWNDGEDRTFTYTDGGVLQNQPLGMAKNLVDEIDGHLGSERRFYLFVSPNPMDNRVNSALTDQNTTIFAILERLVTIYMGQAMFRDWVQADGINKQIDLLDDRADQLTALLSKSDTPLDPAPLTIVAEQMLPLLYSGDGGDLARATDFARLTAQYALEVARLGGLADNRAKALVLSIQLLEKAAGLGRRDRMYIYDIVVDPGILAGAGIASFEGFFDVSYRQHDYECGRQKAVELLASINRAANSAEPGKPALGPIRFEPPVVTRVEALDGLKLRDILPAKKKLFKDGLTHRVNQLLAEELDKPLERYPAQLGADLAVDAVLTWEFNRNVQA